MNPTIAARLKPIIAVQLCVAVEDVRDAARYVEDLGADSLALAELALAIEEAFDVEIPDGEIEKLRSVRDTIQHLAARAR